MVSETCRGISKKVAAHDRADDDRGVQKSSFSSSNPYFTGRDKEIEKIREQLKAQGKAALYGLGGMGKTQTVAEYVDRYQTAYEWIFWVNADESTLAASFGGLAEIVESGTTLKLDEQIAVVKRWLRTRTDSVLLIFDNADEPELLKLYLPSNPNVRVLLTSRASVFDALGIANPIALEKLTSDQSVEFLFKRTGQTSKTEPEWVAAKKLAKELDGLPLALEQAGAFMRELEVSFTDYLTRYEEARLAFLEEQKPVVGNYPESVRATWVLNFRAVARRSLASAQVLELSAFLAADDIPYELLTVGAEQLGEAIRLALAGKSPAEARIALAKLLKPLADYSLIRRDQEKQCYSIHRLVQEVLRDRLEVSERQQWVKRAVEALAKVFPSGKFETWRQCERLLTHVQGIYQHLGQHFDESLDLAKLLNATGYYLYTQGHYSGAELFYKKSLLIRQQMLGDTDLDTANVLNNLALIYHLQKRYSEAELLYEKSFLTRQRLLESNHVDIAGVLSNLALLHQTQESYVTSEALYLWSLSIYQNQVDGSLTFMSTCLNNLAGLYKLRGRYDEAKLLYQQSLELELKRQQPCGNHPDIAGILNNLAGL